MMISSDVFRRGIIKFYSKKGEKVNGLFRKIYLYLVKIRPLTGLNDVETLFSGAFVVYAVTWHYGSGECFQ